MGAGIEYLMSEQRLAAVAADGVHVEIDVDDSGVSPEAVGNEHLESG